MTGTVSTNIYNLTNISPGACAGYIEAHFQELLVGSVAPLFYLDPAHFPRLGTVLFAAGVYVPAGEVEDRYDL